MRFDKSIENEPFNNFLELIAQLIAQKTAEKISNKNDKPNDERKLIKGIRGLAAYLNISTSTAQEIKTKNPSLVHYIGKLTYFFADEIDSALKSGKIRFKRK